MAKPDRSFCHVAIAISDYGSGWQSLPQIREPAEHLARLFGADLQQFERGGLVSEVAGAVRRLIDGVSLRGTLLLHWVGHGSASGEQHYLICKDSPAADRLDETQAFATELLGRLIAQSKAEQVCIILDTCYSGDGAIRLANRLRANLALQLPREGWNRVFSIIASAHPLESVDAGRFSQGLVAALERPDVYGKWSRADEYITTEQLARGARHILEVGDTPMRPVGFKDGIDDVMIPNPLFRPACGESDLDTRRFLEGVFGDNGHFALSAKGVEAQEAGYFFSGRRSILAALHDRLGDGSDEDGLTIVTGPPGSGKSAVIGRLVSLSVPALRAAIERAGGSDANTPLRPIGVDIAIHAKGKTLPECVRIAAHVLGPDRATVEESETVALLGSVRALGRPLLFVFDALDEAAEGQAERIANELIRPLAAIPGVKVLVGTRRSLRGDVLAADEDRHGRLRAAFGTEARIFDLADEPETAADIAEFVVRRLNSATHLGTERWRTRAGHAVAAVAEGSFLYARLVARSLEALPDEPLDDLPADANAAFASDLARRFAGEEVRVTETLRALAFGLGRGLSRSVWVVVANALARERRYTDDDVAWIVTRVGSYIVETSVKIGGRHQRCTG